MIYIHNNRRNRVVIDSYLSNIPNEVDIILDGEHMGVYENSSTDKRYILFYLSLDNVKENKECSMKIYYFGSLIKTELVSIMKEGSQPIIAASNNNKIKQYERKR